MGTGEAKYYKLYSQKNDIEFIAIYSGKRTSIIDDYYLKNIQRRDVLTEAYKIIYRYLSDEINQIKLSNLKNTITVSSVKELGEVLSKGEIETIELKDFGIYIKEDLIEFSTTYYEFINDLNDELVKFQKEKNYQFSTKIFLNNNSSIELYKLFDKPYVCEENGNQQELGQALDEFIMKYS